jgi:hypothetical protein
MKKQLIIFLSVIMLMLGYSSPKAAAATADTVIAQDTAIVLAYDTAENLSVDDDYALMHFYRINSVVGAAIKYNVHLGDTVICRVGNRWKQTVKVDKEGLATLWARTESKIELPVDIKFGKEYYIRCSVKMGIVAGRPKLELVDNQTGEQELQSIKEKEPKKEPKAKKQTKNKEKQK